MISFVDMQQTDTFVTCMMIISTGPFKIDGEFGILVQYSYECKPISKEIDQEVGKWQLEKTSVLPSGGA